MCRGCSCHVITGGPCPPEMELSAAITAGRQGRPASTPGLAVSSMMFTAFDIRVWGRGQQGPNTAANV